MECILNLYGFLEFMWNNKVGKQRKYFFATKVMLFFILERLGVQKDVPLLKNQDRNDKQLQALGELLVMEESTMFSSYR